MFLGRVPRAEEDELRTDAILATLLWAASGVHATQGDRQDRPHMNVIVCNQVGMSHDALRTTGDVNARIFRNAGVEITWIEAESNCTTSSPLPSRNGYFVVITPRVPKGWTTGADSMGLALRSDAYRHAYIFYDRVQEFANTMKLIRDLRISTTLVLGHVVSHELGHLLLRGKGLSSKGIMSEHWSSADWSRAVSGTLLFDEKDAQVIQRELTSNSPSH